MSLLRRVLGTTLLGCLVVFAAYDYATFDDFESPTPVELEGVSAAVIFTGAYARLDAGLLLLARKQVPRLFISGFNHKSGVFDGFTETYAQRTGIGNLQELMDCCVDTGIRARSTFQNALETRCWVDEKKIAGSLVLVTSRKHMARALADMRGSLPFRKVIPYPVFDLPRSEGEERLRNFAEYLATYLASWVPLALDPREPGAFKLGCPVRPT